MDDEITLQSDEVMPPGDNIGQAKEDIESPASSYISKILNQCTGKPWTPESSTLIAVNQLVWRRLPAHERIWWGLLGSILLIKGTSPRLIKMVTPDIANASQDRIRLAEEEEMINFYTTVPEGSQSIAVGQGWTSGYKQGHGPSYGKRPTESGTSISIY